MTAPEPKVEAAEQAAPINDPSARCSDTMDPPKIEVEETILDEADLVDENELLVKQPATISNEAFDRARGKAASIPPNAESDMSLISIHILIEVEDAVGIAFPSETPTKTANGIKSLLIDGVWPESSTAIREAMVQILRAIDPSGYPKEGHWRKASIRNLQTAFLAELEHHERLVKPHAALQRTL